MPTSISTSTSVWTAFSIGVLAISLRVQAESCTLTFNRSVVIIAENEKLAGLSNLFTTTIFPDQEIDAPFDNIKLSARFEVNGQIRDYDEDMTAIAQAQYNSSFYRFNSVVFWQQITSSAYFNHENVQSINIKVTVSISENAVLWVSCNSSFTVIVQNVNEYQPEIRAVRVNGSRIARRDQVEFPVDCENYDWSSSSSPSRAAELVGTVVAIETRDGDLPDTVSLFFDILNFTLHTQKQTQSLTEATLPGKIDEYLQFTQFGLILLRDIAFCRLVSTLENNTVDLRINVIAIDSGLPALSRQHSLQITIRLTGKVAKLIAAASGELTQQKFEWNVICTVLLTVLITLILLVCVLLTLLIRSRKRVAELKAKTRRPKVDFKSLDDPSNTPLAIRVARSVASLDQPDISPELPAHKHQNGHTIGQNHTTPSKQQNGFGTPRILREVTDYETAKLKSSPSHRSGYRETDPDLICEQSTWG